MAAYQRQPVRPGRAWSTQIDGNTVRKAAPEIYIPERREEALPARRAIKRRQQARQMSPAYVLFLSIASVVVLAACIGYLRVQASINSRMSEIQSLESQLEEMIDLNESARTRIEAASDINQIYRTATEELGMVYPDDSQVIYYDQTEREYVQQYESIPKE